MTMNTFTALAPEPLLKYLTGLSLAPGETRPDLLVTLLDADVRCYHFGIPAVAVAVVMIACSRAEAIARRPYHSSSLETSHN